MALSFHKVAIAPVITGLKNAHFFINKGYEHAKATDPNEFLTASIHPDMKDFRYQVYRFTDAAKFIPSRVNPALEGMTLPDEEQTFPELLARVEKTIKYLEGFSEKDFEGKHDDEVVVKFGGVKQMRLPALDYVTKFAHPNMWFHIVTAYDILRMKGVDVGKMDFLNGTGAITIEDVSQ
ncbi:hypothetical protein J4E85_009668 [Alternaria conjuncta]|uniref:uncharacterized protein n=1 Tax=Alternaria conjuncta TaxID=181017 RepID=UPI00221EE0ED|nr:uncharacterized protein J4E85_009668 [Alternaria conjuncta]KAI4918879.1 hypothetical protein J4E85_009668 [Alternaria conjuncta]